MMDTSHKYLKMCEKAKEIQNEWTQHDKDFFICHMGDYDPKSIRQMKRTWLPRQDQIQDLYKMRCKMNLLNMFCEWFKDKFIDKVTVSDYSTTTMEQLWLRFYMQDTYNKIWNNIKEEWNETIIS